MEITLNQLEEATLLLHMTAIRKNVKKGFKKAYESQEAKQNLMIYDKVIESLKSSCLGESAATVYYFESEEINMILSFLNFYIPELKGLLAAAPQTPENLRELNALNDIREQIELFELVAND